MHDFSLYDVERLISRRLWRPLRLLASALHPLPILSGAVLFLIFAFTGQLRELYYANAEILFSPEWVGHAILGGGALFLTSVALYLSNYALASLKIDAIYANGGNVETDMWLRGVRASVGMLAAYLPWLGVAAGFVLAAEHTQATLAEIGTISDRPADLPAGLQHVVTTFTETLPNLWIAAAVVAGVGAVCVWGMHRLRHSIAFRWSAVTALWLVIAMLAIAPLPLEQQSFILWQVLSPALPDPVVLFRAIGPIGTIALTFTALFWIASAIAHLASRISFPVLPATIVIVAAMVVMEWPPHLIAWTTSAAFAILAALGFLSRQVQLAILSVAFALLSANSAQQLAGVGRPAGPAPPNADAARFSSSGPARADAATADIGDAFRSWLDARVEARKSYEGRGGFPVFIVAAQGGGIYAATATQAFLAEAQSRCPSFAAHVFAISAVSGGAIGAALFQSDLVGSGHAGETDCGLPSQALAAELPAARVVGADHLSPLVGTILADLLGVVSDRARALERSFALSAREHRLGGDAGLDGPFTSHWSAAGAAPALVLNTTWSETGYRVAFAPFRLEAGTDDTLLSFRDVRFAGTRLRTDSVISAAVASARFPGMLPAYTLPPLSAATRKDGDGSKRSAGRWNFVDGGYADNSGAATASDLYRALAAVAASDPRYADVDLRLILLTSYRPPLDFKDIEGTIARDSAAPLMTLFNVRELLSQQAVKRALIAIEGSRGATTNAARDGQRDGWKAAVVELDQNRFNLPLGWRISQTTRQLVAALMGAGAVCTPAGAEPVTTSPTAAADDGGAGRQSAKRLQISADKIRGNACVIEAINALLRRPDPPT
ncbi:MAG: hypothetical protein NW217_14660 [Hyphomicrobiaceae bacterium]|nr:hypothetical protein [Hyphomicrobiaceae bacterium]